jgi:RNA polymerase sigma factor (sigma-70 family)
MERGSANFAFRQIGTLYNLGTIGGLTDAQLLGMFLTRGGDDAEHAFAALVHRHGPMVLGVCRRVLRGTHDAEDSFQATFLILVRRAASIGQRQQLANWLYGVAVRTAKQARRRAGRQRARERRLMETSRVEPAPVEDRAELLSLLDEELNRLPRHYRAALVACELEGKARREAALQLGLPEGTLSAHLARGRKLLHKRLVRRGVSLGVGPFAGLPRQIAVATVPERLAGSTVQAALGYMAGGALTGAVPATVAALVEGGLKMMFLTRLVLWVATISAVGMAALAAGVAWSAIPTGPGEPPTAQVTPKAENRPAAGKLTLRAVTAATNEPIEGVSILYRARIDDKFQQANVTTEEDGTATIEWAAGSTVHYLWFTASKPNFASIHIRWDDDRHPLQLPSVKELQFEPGITIGGIVQDKAGQPIEGATVAVYAPPTEYEGSNYVFSLGQHRTDARGHWRLDGAPLDLSVVGAVVNHPRYRQGNAIASRNLDSATVLTKGLTVTGRVVDKDGHPIKGARAIIGHDTWGRSGPPKGTTNEQGEFTLENCDAGPTIVTVQAEGFAPQFRDVQVQEQTAPVVIPMAEPGSTVRVKVVDVQGKPIAGAYFAADTWRAHRSIHFRAETGPDGRVEWLSAPKDEVLYDIGNSTYMWSRHVALTASEREQTVILRSKLVISGRVTDAETNRLVPAFRVVQGQQDEKRRQIDWSENAGVDVQGGQYTSMFGESGSQFFVRVEAPGYKPAQSRAFLSTEGSQAFNFALQRAAGLSGVVVLPDGKPADGVEVSLATATQSKYLTFHSGRLDRGVKFPKVTTGADGRFTFPLRDGSFLLIAMSNAGYADASSNEFAKSGKLVLQLWGQMEGGVRIGPRSGSYQDVAFRPIRPESKGGFYIHHVYTASSDERGRFRFDRVIPGPGTIARIGVIEYQGMTTPMACWQEPIEVGPGQTVEVRVGGKGRPVIGRFVLDGTPAAPVDWTHNEPVVIGVAERIPGSKRIGSVQFAPIRFASKIDKDGRFRVEDVPAGQYTLEVRLGHPGFGLAVREIARVTMTVTVPEIPGGRTNEPLDLGTIKAQQLK